MSFSGSPKAGLFAFTSGMKQELLLQAARVSTMTLVESFGAFRSSLFSPRLGEIIVGLRKGKILAYPTDTVYGLGASAFSLFGLRRVLNLKQRPEGMPLSLLLPSVEAIQELALVPEAGKPLISTFLPGPLTLVLPAREEFWRDRPGREFLLKKGKLGVRVVPNPVLSALTRFCGPLSATSANLHQRPEPASLEELMELFGTGIDFYLSPEEEDFFSSGTQLGPKEESYLYGIEEAPGTKVQTGYASQEVLPSLPSTVVEVLETGFRVLREGAIPAERIKEIVHGPRCP